ncbi:MAG TPA: diacylglycerol kinase family protein [Thermoanaerobaculia bacterium]
MPAEGTLFLNRSSGVKLPPDEVEELREAACARKLEVIELSRDVNVPATIREHRNRGVKLFIAAGGDGTVHHVLQGLVHTEAALGVLPIGTYNHFARDLELPLDWREALRTACEGQTIQIDTARANERYFVNNLSLGLYPELVARREERGRDYPRWKARLYAFYWTARKYPHVTLTMESESRQELVRTSVFLVSNGAYDLTRIGIDAPRETLMEGKMSVYWLPRIARWELTRFIARFLAGRVRGTPGFRSYQTQRLRVTSRHTLLKVGMDGELFIMQTPIALTIAPASLLVRVGA